jgi:hypothetical protein
MHGLVAIGRGGCGVCAMVGIMVLVTLAIGCTGFGNWVHWVVVAKSGTQMSHPAGATHFAVAPGRCDPLRDFVYVAVEDVFDELLAAAAIFGCVTLGHYKSFQIFETDGAGFDLLAQFAVPT